ncbi:hypothetical protein VOLCADRAFT_91338 [Volvox carteri f. nagariensis]|uniref:Uncharacterized protein n=1 Tax=Volvox carteri f. nagariensis TaxID=3068 RepID=D8TWT4_VOLCA|nr:uncharacterized protein VOLCADRAFT_91338 [Volvox carteri f. nagariensis]EFJ48207.1 hypothetical protein VOLCADRAFT_91338 [Volvox carteri f. nagariensis]|eukprot:XP_002950892.1 hypothetical protein VOLCADRAFT_91338 [Volvox carteri f. nagariensis]
MLAFSLRSLTYSIVVMLAMTTSGVPTNFLQEASDLISEKTAAHEEFKRLHNGKKPATGRQIEAMLRAGINVHEDLTKEDASKLLETALQNSDEPVTEQQAIWLNKQKIDSDNMPKVTKAEAITFIGDATSKRKTATNPQNTFIRSLYPHIKGDVLNKLTRAQAAQMIDACKSLKHKHGSGGSCKGPTAKREPERRMTATGVPVEVVI